MKDPDEEVDFNNFVMLTASLRSARHCPARRDCFVEYNDTKFVNKICYIYDLKKKNIFDNFFKSLPKLRFLNFSPKFLQNFLEVFMKFHLKIFEKTVKKSFQKSRVFFQNFCYTSHQ